MRVQLHLKCIVGLEGGRGYTERERGNKENKYEQINMRAAEWVGRQRQSALVKKKIWEEVSIKHMCKI